MARRKLTKRQRAARKGVRTRRARRAFIEEANRYLERVVKRQESVARRKRRRGGGGGGGGGSGGGGGGGGGGDIVIDYDDYYDVEWEATTEYDEAS